MQESEDFDSAVECGSNDAPDSGVHSGRISPACDNGNFFQADSLFRLFGSKCDPFALSAPLHRSLGLIS